MQEPDNIGRTLELVLSLCHDLGYDSARLSLIDSSARVLRCVKAVGGLSGADRAEAALDGTSLEATVIRESRPAIIPDAIRDPRCDPEEARSAGIRGEIVLPLVCGEVIGTLQVASAVALYPTLEELCTLETLASEAARALTGLKQMEHVRELNRQLEERNAPPGTVGRRPGGDCRRRTPNPRVVVAEPGTPSLIAGIDR